MTDTLQWTVVGEQFEDGSMLLDWKKIEESEYAYSFGGQACRMVLVAYKSRGRSPHSRLLMSAGDREWVRTYEVDESIHTVVKAGKDTAKYGAPFMSKQEAA